MELVIISNQTTATAILQEISQVCARYGAQWHPELRVEVDTAGMRLLAPPGTSGQLISMPTHLLVPIAGAQWSSSPDALELLQAPRDSTMVQRELLNLHIKLYNTTRKLDWWVNQHPARLAEKSREVTLLLEQLKPCFQAQAKQSIAEGFLTTRSFDWPSNAEQQQCRPVLMPLIDLLNHHNQGARYRITNGAMQIQAKQAGGSECFAHYGNRRDVLDLALHYGHCDLSTPFAHCAPLTTAVDGLGYIRIETQRLGAPMHAFDPPRVTLEHDGVRLSHLCCHRDHPERVQTMLSLALQAHLKHRGFTAASALKMVSSGLEAIGEANMLLLKQLAAAALASSHPAAPTLAAAAQHQGAIIKAVLHK